MGHSGPSEHKNVANKSFDKNSLIGTCLSKEWVIGEKIDAAYYTVRQDCDIILLGASSSDTGKRQQ